MTIAEKLQLIAKNVQKVFDSGKQAEYDAFWDGYQQNGNRTDYTYAFGKMWAADIFKPKHDMENIVTATGMFYQCNIPKPFEILENLGRKISFTNTTTATNMFYYSLCIELGELDFSNIKTSTAVFSYSTSLKKIKKLILSESTALTNSFTRLSALTEIEIGGTIGQDGYNFKDSTSLDVKSLRSILKALSLNASGKSITLATVHQAIVESDTECIEHATAATNAGWTIAYD